MFGATFPISKERRESLNRDKIWPGSETFWVKQFPSVSLP